MKYKVLIVDDVVANIFLLEGYLSDEFYVVTAQNSQMMWKALFNTMPDVILLDIMLPYENGFEIIKKLKANDKYNNIPVIFVTAKDTKEDVINGLKLGAVDYIIKPVDEKILIGKIKKALRNKIKEEGGTIPEELQDKPTFVETKHGNQLYDIYITAPGRFPQMAIKIIMLYTSLKEEDIRTSINEGEYMFSNNITKKKAKEIAEKLEKVGAFTRIEESIADKKSDDTKKDDFFTIDFK